MSTRSRTAPPAPPRPQSTADNTPQLSQIRELLEKQNAMLSNIKQNVTIIGIIILFTFIVSVVSGAWLYARVQANLEIERERVEEQSREAQQLIDDLDNM